MLLVLRMVEERFHRDVEGRPIREGRTPREYLRDGDLEYKACPYSGMRHGRPMNAAALRQTGAHWDEILDTLARLREAYGGGRELMDLWRVGQLGSALPWWFLLREEPCPAYAAALSKATLGVGIWAQRLLVRVLAERWTVPPLDAAAILETAEASGTLAGPHEVCAGSERMLRAFFEVLTGETSRPGGGTLVPAGAIAFGEHYLQLKLLLWLLHLARRFALAEQGTDEARRRLAEPVEPPDFFLVEPPDPARVPRPARGAWFLALAQLVAPGRGTPAYHELARRLAAAMAAPGTPHDTQAALEALRGELLATADAGVRAALFG